MENPSGATTETTNSAADASGSANPGAESPPAANGPGEKERIDELTGNWRETQRDRDFWRDRALATERGTQRQASDHDANNGSAEGGADDDVKTLADFKYDEKAYGKYIRDLARNDARAETEKLRGELQGQRTESEKRAAVGDFQERATSWAKEQKLENAEQMFAAPGDGGPAVTDTMAEVIMTSDHGPAILNYLTRNKAESRRIHALSPALQAREIGRLEAKFASAPTPSKVSEAPPPHEQVKGASDTSTKKDPAQMSDSEWFAAKQRSDRARRNAQGGK